MKPFTSDFLSKNVLETIFKVTAFKESRRTDPKQPPEYLYNYGKGCSYFILILSGEATIEVGKEKLEFPAGQFAYFGTNALLCGAETPDQVIQQECSLDSYLNEQSKKISKQYVPDFSVRVDDKCVYMKLERDLWRKGFLKSRYETKPNQMTDNIDLVVSNDNSNINEDEEDEEQEDNQDSSKLNFFSKLYNKKSKKRSPTFIPAAATSNQRKHTHSAENLESSSRDKHNYSPNASLTKEAQSEAAKNSRKTSKDSSALDDSSNNSPLTNHVVKIVNENLNSSKDDFKKLGNYMKHEDHMEKQPFLRVNGKAKEN